MGGSTIELKLVLVGIIWILGTCNAEFTPADNYLINCGSTVDATVGQRVFTADNSASTILTSPQSTAANTSLNLVSGFDNAVLYQTARIFAAPSSYAFKMKSRGRHFVRLHFFPFRYQSYDLAAANFKVSTQDVVLLNNFTPPSNSTPVFREYSLNITRDMLILTFVPQGSSTSFINAIEVISVPDDLITDSALTVDPVGQYLGLATQPLQTFYRINVGGPKVTAENDTLWRTWATDQSFFVSSTATQAVTYRGKLNYQKGEATEEDAPDSVYNTARQLVVQNNGSSASNMTWQFNVDGRSSYLIRTHFCDIVSKTTYALYFGVYVDSWSAAKDLDLSHKGILAVPYYIDIVLPSSDPSGKLSISIGPSSLKNVALDGILNGLEIMKMNISTGSVDVVEPPPAAKRQLAIILGPVLGGVGAIIIAAVLCVVLRRKNRTTLTSGNSYRIPFVVLQEATNNFDEQMVIGVGGFGKVYKAVLQDNTKVAVKRGNQKSQQGIREFRTEIELLSELRHRHLVSLIGYCDERNEMILVYEYMENGTLKSHLYGSDLPPLSWNKRLEICLGAARGLHYLHTGFAKSIIHRDVKSANILLDENLMAKVSDFGISKTGPEFDQTHVTTLVKGSFGYLDPEYCLWQKLTDKSDVYSFGVVLLEVICARPVIDPTLPREMISLPCGIQEFPSKYLGLPLSLRKLTKAQLQPTIDRLADQLPGWKADLMTRAGRAVLIQYVLTAMLVYFSMAIELPAWAIKAIDKIRRGFLWRGRKDAKGGHCLIAWAKVERPRELGGLGISNLKLLGWSLKMRWLWLQKTDPGRPWSGFQIQVHESVRSFFSMAMETMVGNGANTLFWKDRWLFGQRIEDVAPLLVAAVPARKANKLTVLHGLPNHNWIRDIQGALSVGILAEFINLWDLLSDVELQPEVADVHRWRLSSSGFYSAKSAYDGFFEGSVKFRSPDRIWKTWAPGRCRFFMWTVVHKRCWTADRLAKRGLPHPVQCPHCDQAEETIDHLLTTCVFARQFWFSLLNHFGLQTLAPTINEASFEDWWFRAVEMVNGNLQRGINSLIILGAWTLWKHRNKCVFDAFAANMATALLLAEEEAHLWALAGARGLSFLSALVPRG